MVLSYHELAAANATQPMEATWMSRFTWRIENFTQINWRKHYSNVFVVGGYKWRMLIYPKGNNVDHLSIYLGVADLDSYLPYSWCHDAQFRLAVENQTHQKYTIHKDIRRQFNACMRRWGFTTYFMPLIDLYDPSRGYLVNDTVVVKADVAVCGMYENLIYASRKRTIVCLKKQGAICYINSVIRTLYHMPYLRNVVYRMPTNKNDLPHGSVLLGLHSLFRKFHYSDHVATEGLAKSFGWDAYDSFLEHYVQGLNGVQFEKYKDNMRGASVEVTIGQLLKGYRTNYIKYIHVNTKSTMKDSFDDVHYVVEGCCDVYTSANKYVEVEQQDGSNGYHAENHGLQINDAYEFPWQPDLDKHDGKHLASDAYRSIRNLYTPHRYKCGDECRTKDGTRKALEDQYGFKEEDLWSLPPEKSKEDIFLFFLLNNSEKDGLRFVRRLLIKTSEKPSEILTKPSEMVGFTRYEEIEFHVAGVKFMFATISSQKLTLGVLHPTLQFCLCFCRSSSSSRRPAIAPTEACSVSWIISLKSLAIHRRSMSSLVFDVLPKLLELSTNLLNKFREEHVRPPLMETAAGKVPELPWEILMDIFALLEIPDLVRAGSVCSYWNSVYTSICNIGQYKQPQTPCLLYTSESAGENVACLYSLAEKRTYKLTLPEPPIHRRYLIGSSHGWVVTVDEQSEMHIVNPITGEQIALPSVITTEQVAPVYDNTGAICKYHYSMNTTLSVGRPPLTLAPSKLRYYFHHKALVFLDTSVGSYIVVFIHNPFGRLLFARLGDDKWTRLSSHERFQDCIYMDGLLYAVTSFGEIIAFDLSEPVITTKIILDRVKNHHCDHRVYIVQAPWGDLLQVWRPEVWIQEVDVHHEEATFENKTKEMEIYRVCTAGKKVVQINSLGDHVLFLGSNQSLCSRAEEYPQLKPNHVYFTDDVEGVACSIELGYRLNIGVLNFGNKSMEEIIFPRPWSNCLAPLLIVPNPRKKDSALPI